jgi:hypothetical protein
MRARLSLGALFGVGLLALPPAPIVAQTPITEQEAHAIGVDAYVYFYPLVTMDVTRKQLTNHSPGPGVFGGPMNMFANVEAFPPADFKAVVRRREQAHDPLRQELTRIARTDGRAVGRPAIERLR